MGASESHQRIVLLGKTGDGKSSAGNTILKQEVFKSKASPESVTAECVSGDRKVYGKKITVIDTPGLFDTGVDEETIKSEIIRSVIESSPGPDMFTIVLKVGRYTGQEMEIVDKIVECSGEDTFNHSVVLFTHGEQLEGQTIEEYVKISPKLQELVNKCGGRCHVIDSKYWKKRQMGYRSNRVQVKKLLGTIEEKLKDNNNSCYTNELIQMVEEKIQEEVKNMNEVSLSPEEKREIAKKIVHKKLLIRLAGVATGTLTGAFLGIGVAMAYVINLLKAVTIAGAAAVGISGLAAGASELEAGASGLVTGVSGLAAGSSELAAGASGLVTGVSGLAAGSSELAAGASGLVTGVSGLAAGASELEAGASGLVTGVSRLAAGVSGLASGASGLVTGASGLAVGASRLATRASGLAAGMVAVEAGLVTGNSAGIGAGLGAAAGSGITAGIVIGAAALAGAIGGGVTGCKAADESDSVCDAIINAAKLNYENAKGVVKKAQNHQHKLLKIENNDN